MQLHRVDGIWREDNSVLVRNVTLLTCVSVHRIHYKILVYSDSTAVFEMITMTFFEGPLGQVQGLESEKR